MSSKIQLLQSEQTEFKKGLGLFDATTLVMGSMIGSGVFVVAAGMLQKVPYPNLMLSIWVVCGIITLMGALSYAEMASSMPKAGGPYVYLREAFGSFWAFLYGWTLFFAVQTGTIAAVAVVFGRAGYALFSKQPYGSIGAEAVPVKLLALACLVFLTIWNIFGIRMGAVLQNIFTVLKVGAILILIVAAFFHPSVASGVPSWPTSWGSISLWTAFGAAMVGALWAYDAWFNVMFAGEEVVNAKKTLPQALVLGTFLVMVLYCLCNWVYVHVLPVAQIQNLENVKGIVGIEAAKVMLGASGALFITVAILFSTFGCTNGILLSGPRAYYALAKDGLFFHKIAELHPVYKTPVFALLVQLLWSSLLVFSGTYDQLFTYVEFATFLFYAITVVGLFVLRKKYPDLPRPFKVPSLIPVIYFIFVVAFLLNTLWTQPRDSFWGLAIIALGGVVYLFIRKAPEKEGEKV
jgi:APA family basic amino acid/polyamine antiporter